ncbi:MAG: tetratricopeptide repeat protein [Candidatus Omnitrophota bacterium]
MEIKDRFKKDKNALLNIALAYAKKDEIVKAKEYFQKALETAKDIPEIYLTYGSHLLQFIMKGRAWRFGLSSENIKDLEESERLLTQAINLLKTTDKKTLLEDAYINRSSVRAILDKFDLAINDINAVLEIDPKNPLAYANKAKINVLTKNQDEAIVDFKKALDGGASKDDIMPTLVSSYVDQPEPRAEEAIAAIKQYYKEELLSLNIVPNLLLAETYVSKKDYDEASSILKQLYSKFGKDPKILLLDAEIKRAKGETEAFKSLITEVMKTATGPEKNIAIIHLAKHYKKIGSYDAAIPLYEVIVSESLFDDFIKDYLICLYESKENRAENIQKCLEVCKNLIAKQGDIPFVLELQAAIYQQLGSLDKARDLYLRLVKIEPQNYRHKINYTAMVNDIGGSDKEHQIKSLLEIKNRINDKDTLLLLTKFLARTNYTEEAIKQAYKVVALADSDAETQLLYLFLFLKKGKKTGDLILESEFVKEDFYIRLRKDGQESEFLLLDDPGASLVRAEIYKESNLGKAIYGKKIGDKITIKIEGGRDEVVEILGIKSKYVKLFQSILNNFNTYFPSNKTIQKIEANPEKVLEMVKRKSEYASQITQMYLSKKLTIGALSKFMNISLFTAWAGLIAMGNRLFCASGSAVEQIKEQELINKSKEVLLDPLSLFTLAYLDMLTLPTKYFDKVYVTRATIDEIDMSIADETGFGDSEGMSVFYHEGKAYRQNFSAEGSKNKIDFLQKIKDAAANTFNIIGLDKLLEKDLETKEQLLGRPYIYSIQTCKEKRLPLFCDDLLFKELLFNDYKIDSFSIQNFLTMLVQKKLLSESEYYDAVIKLAGLKYYYLSISAQMLLYCAEKNSFQASNDFNAFIDILQSKETTLDSQLNVLTDFMKLIILELPDPGMRRKYLEIILKVVTTDRDPRSVTKKFSDLLKRKLGLIDHVMPLINKEISDWLKFNYKIIY